MQRRRLWVWLILTALCFLKYLPAAGRYYPLLDDYIQYWGYAQYPNAWTDIIMRFGTLATHPMAGLADVYVWARFWQAGFLALSLIAVMHLLSAFLLSDAFERSGIEGGEIFAIVFVLCPVGFEATYWLSAASRLVVGLFFMSLAAQLLTNWLHNGKARHGVGFLCLGLLSLLFYEQVAALAVMLYAMILWAHPKSPSVKGAWLMLFGCVLTVLVYYLLFAQTGKFANRAQLVGLSMLPDRIAALIKSFFILMQSGFTELIPNGFVRGTQLLLTKPLWLVMVGGLCFSLAMLAKTGSKIHGSSVSWGILLFFVPFAPFLILAQGGLALRSVFPSLIGLGVLIQSFLHGGKRFEALVRTGVFALLFVFMAANISEMQDYKQVSLIDEKICRGIAAHLDEAVLTGQRDVVVYGTRWYSTQQNTNHGEHIYSLTQSDWALTGGVRYYASNIKIRKVMPDYLATDEILAKNPIVLQMDNEFEIYSVGAANE